MWPRATCPTRSAGSRPIRTPGSLTEDGFPARANVDDLASVELELLRLFLRELRQQVLAVVADELDARLEAEVNHALDHRLDRAVVGLEPQLDVVGADEGLAEPVDRPDEAHHELVGRRAVELAPGPALLQSPY